MFTDVSTTIILVIFKVNLFGGSFGSSCIDLAVEGDTVIE
jgi:hypothetical protein